MPVIDIASLDLKTITPESLDWHRFVLPADNPMRSIRIDKVVVNMGVGQSGERLEKAANVLKELTGQDPSYRKAKKSIKDFGIRKGEHIGVAVTLRRERAIWFLLKSLAVVDFTLRRSGFDNYGNVSFGIAEHILMPGARYDPAVGIWGFTVTTVLARPGMRVQYRRRMRHEVGRKQRVSKDEAIKFFTDVIGVRVI
ncbi:MAG: 50S ribosomal protein L5 [Thermocladium sp.]|jgi:large subunit ribosomal protein L5